MAEQENEFDPKNLDVTELGDVDLEDVSGGLHQDTVPINECTIENYNC